MTGPRRTITPKPSSDRDPLLRALVAGWGRADSAEARVAELDDRWKALREWLAEKAGPVPELPHGTYDIEGHSYRTVLDQMRELER